MPKAVHPKQTWDYILKAERAEEAPTVFSLRAISARAMAKIEDSAVAATSAGTEDQRVCVLTGTRNFQLLKLGLVGWSNFFFAEGEPAPFKTEKDRLNSLDAPTDETLSLLPAQARQELAEAVLEGNVLTTEDLGN